MNKIIEEDIITITDNIEYEKLQGKNILITGATGMLASYVVFLLHYLNEVKQTDIGIWLLLRNEKKAKIKFGDILKDASIHLLVQDVCLPIGISERIDYVIHGASMADPHSIADHPFEIIKVNTMGTIQVCEFARRHKSKIVFLSTREVYGEVSGDPTTLNEKMYGALDPMNARNCYPESKRAAEATLLSNYNEYGVPFNIVRIAHAFGPGMAICNDGRIMADLINNMVRHEAIILKSDGKMKRAFCYVADAVYAIMLVLLSGNNGAVYNIANESEEIRIIDLANKIAKEIGTRVDFQRQNKAENSRQYLQTRRVALDTTEIRKLGWRPQTTLWEGIMRTYDFQISE